jgi:hypothetical protein
MNKFFLAAALTLVAAPLVVSPASATCLRHRCKQCDKCGTFYVRPYNAFSPVAFGNVTFAGLAMPGYGYGDGGPGCLPGAPLPPPTASDGAAPLPPAPTPTSQAPMMMPNFRVQNAGYQPQHNFANGPMVPMAVLPNAFGGDQ